MNVSRSWRAGLIVVVAVVTVASNPIAAWAQGDPLVAVVDVDANQVLRTIPRSLYGVNLEWENDGNGLLDPTTKSIDPWVWYFAARNRFSYYRFPGGILSDYYFWPNGVGARELRPMVPPTPGAPPSSNAFGTLEAYLFAKFSGGDLLVTVNAGTGTADLAAAWVSFVNGRDGVLPPKTRVKIWEVGNELYSAQGGLNAPITVPPDVYTDRFLQFATAMRDADPSIELMAIGGTSYGDVDFISYPDWNETLLTQAGSQIDYLAVHNAYFPAVFNDDHLDLRTVYAAMLASPLMVRDNLATLEQEIALWAPGSDIKVAITEWVPLFQFLKTSPYVDHTRTLGSALYVASILKVFIESPITEIAHFFTLLDSDPLSFLGRYGSIWFPKPSYFAMELYTRHFGTQLIASTTTSPTFDTQQVGRVQALTGVPYLETVASLSDDGNEMFIMIINKHFDEPISTWFQLDGFVPDGTATAWALAGPSVDSNTGTELFSTVPQAQDPVNPRFYEGGPGEVQIYETPITNAAETFLVQIPRHSVMVIQLTRANP